MVCLDSDFSTFHLYDLKKQHRFATWKFKAEGLVDPKVYIFKICLKDSLVIVGGDHAYSGEDGKKKLGREAFLSLHKLQSSFECLHVQRFSELDKQLTTMSRDDESGVIFVGDYGRNVLVVRITAKDKINVVQLLRDVHTDYPFSMVFKDNRLYTCSLTQRVTVIEFQEEL